MIETNAHLLHWFNKSFDKKSSGSGAKSEIMPNQELTAEIQKQIRKFEKRKLHSFFKGNIWGTDLTDMLLKSRFNKGYIS